MQVTFEQLHWFNDDSIFFDKYHVWKKEGKQRWLTRSMGQLHGPSQRDQSAPRKPFSGLFLPVPSEPLHFIDHMILSRNTNEILGNPHPCLRNKKEILGNTHPCL